MRDLSLAVLATIVALAGCGMSARPAETTSGGGVEIVQNAAFDAWLTGFRPRALAAGLPEPVVSRALGGAGYIPEVIEKDRNQAESNLTYAAYFARIVSEERVANGRAALRAREAAFRGLEAQYGVPAGVVAAIWGMESAYGTRRGDFPVVSALATLAHDGRRGAFFEGQLIDALRIIAAGEVSPERMLGSWAGAMGHTQFIPSSYLSLAVDGTGDGRRDIWGDDPTDALASTANYLARSGWRTGEPWGLEVRLPSGYAGPTGARSAGDWAALGVARADGGALGGLPEGRLFLPTGAEGPAFLVFRNFDVIKRYNNADIYALAVGHLSDRLAGAGGLRVQFPGAEEILSPPELRELQERLTARGYDTGGVDGMMGGDTEAAVRAYQTAEGLLADGRATPALLARLRR
ncbi:lytic murein transglycosylase [Pseudoroseicyclus tamaricis]|uniref:Lytic murein transglycosylase n=1 Tax=Pseudoroseicyclus tamaricis TaxID=2705421 RepID=A0A6B2K1M7_9RHOB|nr:lytic murein transglycosylase [Pseudoroseicyclus tamaricis]NDV02384.1 lytic murein transglycosylase [Pseudoroseicyclus tamaricis]